MAARLNPYDPPVEADVHSVTPDTTTPKTTENTALRDFGIAVCIATTIFLTMLIVGWIVQVAQRLFGN